MKTAIMVIVIFRVRTRARFRKPIEERRNFPEKKKKTESALVSKVNYCLLSFQVEICMLESLYKKSFIDKVIQATIYYDTSFPARVLTFF